MAMNAPNPDRTDLRQRLLATRRAWMDTHESASAQQQLQARVLTVLTQLEPDCLGIYWPLPGEFNPMDVARSAHSLWDCQLALPYAKKTPVAMNFNTWDGLALFEKDECGIPSSNGKPCVPDVVLVPCVGFTSEGWRLGYGGGYFDRFMAAHPEVTAVGVAWDIGRLDAIDLSPQLHDVQLMAIITESNIFTG